MIARTQRGVTLIEIMIALVLGLLVLAGIFQIYLATRRSYVLAESLAARQEAIRYVTTTMSKDVRMAGYRGCLRDTGEILNTVNPDPADGGRTEFTHTDFLYMFERYVEGFDAAGGGWQPDLPAELAAVVPGTDVLTVRGAFAPEVYVVQQMPTPSAVLQTNPLNPPPFAPGDILLVTDCVAATIFQVTQYQLSNPGNPSANFGTIVHNQGNGAGLPDPGNWDQSLGRSYPAGSQVMRIGTLSYYIRNSASGSGPALWRNVDGNAVEIAEGVENMQVQYGVDTNGDQVPDAYRTADAFTDTDDWRAVVTARVALLVASTRDKAAEADPRSFNLLGTIVGPSNDGRLRRVVTLTISLRNRLP